jgi:site-specific DNA recombinase
VNEAEARTVRWICGRFLEIGSATKLMQELNAQGITTKHWMTRTGRMAGGARWNKMHLYRLLKNRVYVGDVHHKGVYYPGEHQPIVDGEIYDRVQAILAENHRSRGNRTRHETPALLRGIIRCRHCDSAMGPTYTRKSGRVYRYYHCVKATKNGRETCPVRTIAAGEVEQAVIGQVRALFRSPEMIADIWREARRIQAEAPGDWPVGSFHRAGNRGSPRPPRGRLGMPLSGRAGAPHSPDGRAHGSQPRRHRPAPARPRTDRGGARHCREC